MSERSGSLSRHVTRVVAGVVAGVVTVAALTACAAAPARNAGGGASKSAPPTATESRILGSVNSFRAEHGLRALKINSNLEDKSKLWSAYMAGGGCGRAANGVPNICHSSITSFITVHWTRLEENVGMISPAANVTGIESGFEHSPGHAANMLNAQITAMGIGVAYSGDVMYVAEEFMAQ